MRSTRYSWKRYPGIAVYISGQVTETYETDEGFIEEREVEDEVYVTMVGDDAKERANMAELTEIDETEYCSCCGQIGCPWEASS